MYVDDMFKYSIGRYRGMKMSHMIGTNDDELHAMASRLGIRRHFQGDHYDICMASRVKALRMGAVEISMRQLSAMAMLRRWGQEMGDPETAPQRLFKYYARSGVRKPKQRRSA